MMPPHFPTVGLSGNGNGNNRSWGAPERISPRLRGIIPAAHSFRRG